MNVIYIYTQRGAHITNTYTHSLNVVPQTNSNVGTQTLNPKRGHMQIIAHQKKQNAKKQLPISTSGLAAIGARTTGQVCMYVCMYIHTYYVLIKPPMPYITSSPLCCFVFLRPI